MGRRAEYDDLVVEAGMEVGVILVGVGVALIPCNTTVELLFLSNKVARIFRMRLGVKPDLL